MNELFDFIKDYGGYAGAASVLGLAVLSLLYFAQAREVKRLREWAGRAPERAAELEARVAEQARRPTPPPVVRQPPPRPTPGQPQTAAGQAAARPATPNGQTGPPGAVPAGAVAAGGAAAAAGAAGAAAAKPGESAEEETKADGEAPEKDTQDAKPDGEAPEKDAQEAQKEGAQAEAPAKDDAAKEGETAAKDGESPKPAAAPAQTAAPGTPAAKPVTPSPAPAAGAAAGGAGAAAAGAGAVGAAASRPTAPPPRTAAGGAQARPAPRPAAAAPLRSSTPSKAAPPPRSTTKEGGRNRLPIILAIAAAAVLVIGFTLALVLGGGDDGDPTASPAAVENEVQPPANQEPRGETNSSTQTSRGDTTVAVLNGTTIPGLARRTGDRVETSGFTLGTVTDAPVQNRSATIVQYAEGNQDEARTVAEVIGVGEDAVSQLDVSARTVAGEQADVVVTVGADQDQGAGQSG